jgi:tRNA (guanine-N7-)-methyltransferase
VQAVVATSTARTTNRNVRRPDATQPSCLTWHDVAVTSPDALAVRTFKRRAGRVTTTQQEALRRLWSTLGLAVDGRPLDLKALFGRAAPVVLEVGFGMGEATAEMAVAQPDLDVLAVDVHTPGHGNLLKLVAAGGLANVRVASGDARVLLAEMLPSASLAAVRVFFPDPWPKARHAKRRLLTPAFADLVADRLADDGLLHVATDVPAYADGVRAVLAGHPSLVPTRQPPWRAQTRFERRGVTAGRPAHDVAAVRRPRGIPVEGEPAPA